MRFHTFLWSYPIRWWLLLAVVSVALLSIAGCSQQESPAPSTATPILSEDPPILTPAITFTPERIRPTPTATQEAPPTATVVVSPTPASNAEATAGGQAGQTWSLSDIRYSANESRHRLVWEMAEQRSDAPRYEIRQIDTESGIRLEVVLIDVYAYDYPLNEVLPIEPDDGVLERIESLPTFDDASLGFAIVLSTPTDYEAFELTEPVRIVLDIAR